jgi:hypothetical protein
LVPRLPEPGKLPHQHLAAHPSEEELVVWGVDPPSEPGKIPHHRPLAAHSSEGEWALVFLVPRLPEPGKLPHHRPLAAHSSEEEGALVFLVPRLPEPRELPHQHLAADPPEEELMVFGVDPPSEPGQGHVFRASRSVELFWQQKRHSLQSVALQQQVCLPATRLRRRHRYHPPRPLALLARPTQGLDAWVEQELSSSAPL